MNGPNQLSLLRIVLSFVFFIFMRFSTPLFSFCATFVFVVAALSDWLDGYWARKKSLKTVFGSFIDPLADKILLTISLIVFLEKGYISSWMVVLILVREFFVMGFRFMILFQKGFVLPALLAGKIKTIFQFLTLFFILFYHNQLVLKFFVFPDDMIFIFINVLMTITVFITIFSAMQYCWSYKDCFQSKL